MDALTARQQQVLEALKALAHELGRYPTYREIAKRIGVTTLQGVQANLRALNRKGAIEFGRGKRLKIFGACPCCGQGVTPSSE